MTHNILTGIGTCILYLMAGGALVNSLLHLVWSLQFNKMPDKYKNSYMRSHTGNAIAGFLNLIVAALIPALLGYKFGINLNTLCLFLGFGAVLLSLASRLDKKEKK
jgi:hypothetical protein